jgi:putative FmdB family regulatory protein
MPIYAYKCESCGHAKDVLQKMSDAPLSVCPECGVAAFKKQLTSAGFQLKGSGWYVTDFRGGDNASKPAKPADGDASSPAAPGTDAKPAESGTSVAPAAPPPSTKPALVAAAPAASSSDSSSSSSKTP